MHHHMDAQKCADCQRAKEFATQQRIDQQEE
jgi:hypothetical protein